MIAVHALVTRAGQGVPEVADDGVDEKELAVFVPVVSPRIGGAVADDLKCFARGMITPNTAAERCALGFGRTGPADFGAGAEDAVPTVEPAVGPPAQAVDDVVAHLVGIEAVEDDFRFAVRFIVAVFVGEKEDVRRACGPHAAEAELDTGKLAGAVPKDFSFIENTIMIGILKNDDAILELKFEIRFALGVRVTLGDPQPAACVPRHVDRLLYHRLGGGELHAEAFRHRHCLQCLGRRQEWRGDLLGVKRLGGFIGPEMAGEESEGEKVFHLFFPLLGLFFGFFLGRLLRGRALASFSSCCT